jgi:hypothetical protein
MSRRTSFEASGSPNRGKGSPDHRDRSHVLPDANAAKLITMRTRATWGVVALLGTIACGGDDGDGFGSLSGGATTPTASATADGSSSGAPSTASSSSGAAETGGADSSGDMSSSGGAVTADGGSSTSDDGSSGPATTLTTNDPTDASATDGDGTCDQFCNGCACPSDPCTMCCAQAGKVDVCGGGMCGCF